MYSLILLNYNNFFSLGVALQISNDPTNDNEIIFPGDNWFFYWKTSSALWRDKIAGYGSSKIVVPINWAFHTDNGEDFDFHHDKPETDLKKLEEIAREASKKLVFFVPISPAPFLVGGGLPHVLSRIPSISREGIQTVVPEANGRINKIYSFYDQRVFVAYRKFMRALGKFFSQNEMTSNLWAIECGFIQDEQFVSFFEDYSKAQHETFERFLAIKKQATENNQNLEVTHTPSSLSEEELLQNEFVTDVKQLYIETIKEFFPINYEGLVKIAFLGSATDDLFFKMLDAERQNKYSKDILFCLTMNIIPSSILLPSNLKKGIIEKQFKDLVSSSYLSIILGDNMYDMSDETSFLPLTNFYLCHKNLMDYSKRYFWEEIGLYKYLKENFNWAYKINDSYSQAAALDETYLANKIYFYNGQDIYSTEYYHILKMFMNGGKIVVENSSLDKNILKRFEGFFIENSINMEMINTTTRISVGSLGEGRLVFFDGTLIKSLDEGKKINFWSEIIATFDLVNVKINSEQGVDYLWKTRTPMKNELKFEEVRRVYFYNPTSYKKRVKLNWAKNFALLKINEEINSKVQHEPNQSVIEFLPMGSVSIDFGVFY